MSASGPHEHRGQVVRASRVGRSLLGGCGAADREMFVSGPFCSDDDLSALFTLLFINSREHGISLHEAPVCVSFTGFYVGVMKRFEPYRTREV